RFEYDLPVHGRALVVIYDNSGRVVKTLASGAHEAGMHVVDWDGTDEYGRRLPAGVYLVRLETRGAGAVTKTVLMR
ncbi:MAG: T9SS type A sorting domain-containing protein, partial [candidate division WOR-3 bacterium]